MNWGVCRVVDLGQKVPKFVLNESRGHVDSRSGIFFDGKGWVVGDIDGEKNLSRRVRLA